MSRKHYTEEQVANALAVLRSNGGKRRIASWLRRRAARLEKHNDELAPRFTARWLYD